MKLLLYLLLVPIPWPSRVRGRACNHDEPSQDFCYDTIMRRAVGFLGNLANSILTSHPIMHAPSLRCHVPSSDMLGTGKSNLNPTRSCNLMIDVVLSLYHTAFFASTSSPTRSPLTTFFTLFRALHILSAVAVSNLVSPPLFSAPALPKIRVVSYTDSSPRLSRSLSTSPTTH